jgi:NarL family two-component system response regulator LiaR
MFGVVLTGRRDDWEVVMTSVLVLSDCTVFGLGFAAIGAEDESFEILARANGTEGLQLLATTRPDVIVIDYEIDGGKAIELCARIVQDWPSVPILVLSNVLDDQAVRSSIAAGARGYLYKNADRDRLRAAIEWLKDGQGVLDPLVTLRVMGWATRTGAEATHETLSEKELEVLRLVSRGEPNKRIARAMGVSENTVKTYLRRAYRKLGCHTRSAAAAVLAQRGLL